MSSKMISVWKGGKKFKLKAADVDTPDININKEIANMHPDCKYLVKHMERNNKERFSHFHRSHIVYGRRKGLFLTLWVIGVYAYTLHAMKQEHFLDDLPDNLPALPPASSESEPASAT